MAKRGGTEARHLGKAQKKPRHRGRRVALALLVCAVLAGGGLLAWSHAAPLRSLTGQTQDAASDASQTENTTSSSNNEAADGASSVQNAPAAEQVESTSANENESEPEEQEPERQVGDHGAPTADDQAAMATLAGQVSVAGAPAGFADSDGYQELLYQASVWQGYGFDLAFILTDLTSGATVSYNTDQVFYPASSIKGPYVCSLYQEVAEAGGGGSELDSLASRTIVDSDNDAFRSLHENYGESAFLTWLEAAGVPATSGQSFNYFAAYYYPHVSCSQLNLMWSAIYRYCTSGTSASQTLAGYFASRTTSPIAQAVGSREASWGKAGWYYSSGDYGAEPATVDAGVVFGEGGPYQLVMMSSAPGELDKMAELAYGMDRAAADLAA